MSVVAFERPAAYGAGRSLHDRSGQDRSGWDRSEVDRLGALVDAADAIVNLRTDELSEEQIRVELATVDRVNKQLAARLGRLTRALTRRRADRAEREAPEGRGLRERRRAERETRRELTDQLNWAPGEAKRHADDARTLESLPRTAEAMDRGELTARHVRQLDRVLKYLVGPQRAETEAELVASAREQDPVTFGRTCRRRLAELDPEASTREHRNRQARTRASMTETDDGMLKIFGEWTGLDAETIASAVHAFRRPDRPQEHRRPEQRTAEAFVEVARAALRAAEAPATHGVRPHVLLTIPISMLEERAGIAEGTWTGPIDHDALREILDDVGLAWMVTDRSGLPMEASDEKRTVPVGLWRALHLRDGGCIFEGCDAPSQWCDVMHLAEPFACGGRLTLDTAGLGCRRHHRAFDGGYLELHWEDRRPVLRKRAPRSPPVDPERYGGDRRGASADADRCGQERRGPPIDPEPQLQLLVPEATGRRSSAGR